MKAHLSRVVLAPPPRTSTATARPENLGDEVVESPGNFALNSLAMTCYTTADIKSKDLTPESLTPESPESLPQGDLSLYPAGCA